MAIKIIDRTHATASTHRTRNGRNIYSRGNSGARRRVQTIDAIMLHQTSFVSTAVERFDSVIANFIVLQDGHVLKVRDIEAALNSIGTDQRAIDIEFVGDYPSTQAIRRARGRGLMLPPLAQLRAGRELVGHLKSRYRTCNIFGHVQFTAKNCPGPHLWYNVGEWAVHNGLSCSSRGRSIPRQWRDPSLAIPGLSHARPAGAGP